MRDFRRMLASGLTGVLLASMLAGGVAAESPGYASWLPEIQGSDAVAGPLVVQGRLLAPDGRGVTGQLSLIAWPPNSVLEGLRVGDSVRLLPVGKVVAGADGSFALRIDPNVPMAEVMSPDGAVQFELIAAGSSGSTRFFFPRKFAPVGSAMGWTSIDGETSGDDSGVLDVSLPLVGPPVSSAGPIALQPAADRICVSYLRATWNLILDTIGEVYTGPNTNGDLQYISGSSSTLGVGVSATGTYGSWSASGTNSASSTTTIDYPTQSVNRLTVFRTNFGWQKWETQCAGQSTFAARAFQFQGGTSQYTAASAPSATYCTNYLDNSIFTKDSATAITFSNGAKIGVYIGLDLSTRTGFTTSTKIKFTFVNAGKLCGSNGYPPQAARVVGK